ncbi:hypothetical protein ACGF7W_34840 [Streptomyces sp. NPDC048219]|uniref:hypothetical protein n=1 Tax=Streptomyces sp. NPDC048219 TaxID=3365517 RepID=UPI00371D1140
MRPEGITDTTAESLFIEELDGITYATEDEAVYARYSPEDWEAQAKSEADAENGWLRAAETNDRYAWEDEQDRMRAAFYGTI